MEEKFTSLKKFNSKRKKVDLIEYNGAKCILKQYDDRLKVAQEKLLMNKIACTGYAPAVIESHDNYIVYKYIEGESFAEKFRLATMQDDNDMMYFLAKKLCIFMQMFHSIADGYIFGEIDFNNFILSDDRCVSVDFYEARRGMPNEDVAGIIAYALCHCVGDFYSCFPFVFKVLECYHMKIIDIINEMSDCFMHNATYEKRIDKEAVLDALLSYEEKGNVWRYIQK